MEGEGVPTHPVNTQSLVSIFLECDSSGHGPAAQGWRGNSVFLKGWGSASGIGVGRGGRQLGPVKVERGKSPESGVGR